MKFENYIFAVSVLALVSAGTGCAPGPREIPLPPALIGHWETTDPRYEDRFLELSGTAVVLGTGPQSTERYTLMRVLLSRVDDADLYTVEYLGGDGIEFDMEFFFEGGDQGRLRLRNQPDMVWRKVRR